jgi:glycosyltransferase involved in cell wall biosynthesis
MTPKFNAVAERGRVDLELWYNDRRASDRSWSVDESQWLFPYQYLRPVPGLRRFPADLLRKPRPDVLVSLYAQPCFVMGAAIARARGSRTVHWVERTSDRWVRRRPWKEWAKRRVLPRADAILTTGADGRRYVEDYGVDGAGVYTINYFSDAKFFSAAADAVKDRRDELRRREDVKGVAFIYVGRLWRGKGIDTLLTAFRLAQGRSSQTLSLLLVGDGVDEAELRDMCRTQSIPNVRFIGFQQKNDIAAYYAMADVFVFPTLGDPFGQVVEEAMASGLPVISTTAAGEIGERIIPGHNGELVPPGDVEQLAQKMVQMAESDGVIRTLGYHAREDVQPLTEELWAQRFEAMVDAVLF